MKDSIYLIQDDGQLVEMCEQLYDSEVLLQELLVEYPNLLAGDQMDSARPRRWLLIARETSLPSEEDGAGRWSVDHVFLDQDGIPTLVEVKRSTDSRIRREVVGQMLDYAANAVVYWPVEAIRAKFEAACESRGDDPTIRVSDLLQVDPADESEVEDFWSRVKTNLQAGRVRLVFVADKIPQELRRIVEFLSVQMDPAEVLAVEIRQYVGEGLRTLVPRVIGQRAKPVPEQRVWDERTFFQELESRASAEAAQVARSILGWATTQGLQIAWGRGARDGSLIALVDHMGTSHSLIACWTYGRLEVQFQYMTKPPFDNEDNRLSLLHRLNQIPDLSLPDHVISRRPSIPLSTLIDKEALQRFFAALDWAVQEIRGEELAD